jgi:hypothetical protein
MNTDGHRWESGLWDGRDGNEYEYESFPPREC